MEEVSHLLFQASQVYTLSTVEKPPSGYKYVFRATERKHSSQILRGEFVQLGPNDFLTTNFPGVFERLINGRVYVTTAPVTLGDQEYTVGIFELITDPDWQPPALTVGERLRNCLNRLFI